MLHEKLRYRRGKKIEDNELTIKLSIHIWCLWQDSSYICGPFFSRFHKISYITPYARFSLDKGATEGDNNQDIHFSTSVVIVLMVLLIP